MVLWIIGKSGAGKTTVGRLLYRKLNALAPNTVFLDGDELRAAVGNDLGYSVKDRQESERRTSRLCKLLADQGIHVICAKLANAPGVLEWNRKHIDDYRDIYIKVDDSLLLLHDAKGLYRKFARGEVENVVGEDIPFHEPHSAWLTIENDFQTTMEQIADQILQELDLPTKQLA